MAKGYGRISSGGSSGGRGYRNAGSSSRGSRGVSPARLSQKTGSSNAFGGYAKVKNADGTFRMRSTGK